MRRGLPRLKPQSKAKHIILRNYLNAWLPIMTSWNGRVLYVDGFAGPGRYQGGEDGSPVIFVKAVTEHCLKLKGEIVGLFVEKNPEVYGHLERTIKSLSLPDGINLSVIPLQGEFESVMEHIFASLEEVGSRLAPPFFFIDPFGYSQVSMNLVSRIMEERGAEVFVNFMYSFVNRFISVQHQERNFDRLFGCDEWRQYRSVNDPMERREGLCNLYREQLLKVAGAKYVRSFEIKRGQRTVYLLFFATKHVKGFDAMKRAMRKADPSGNFTFSDVTDPRQHVLFQPEIDTGALREMLLSNFAGRTVTVGELERFVAETDRYISTDLRTRTLVPMEREGLIRVDESTRRRRYTYPRGTKVIFPPQKRGGRAPDPCVARL